MIPLTEYEHHILNLWFECGTVGQHSGGLTALDWPVIDTWAKRFYTESYVELIEHPRISKRHKPVYTPIVTEECSLTDWELMTIRNMSQEYATEYSQASDKNRLCPKTIYAEDISEDEKMANATAIAQAFKDLYSSET